MGTIKRLRKKFQTPSHLWQKERILEEKESLKEYGLKNKREIWKMTSLMARFKALAKEAISSDTEQSEKESVQLLSRLRALGLLSESSMLSDVLTLTNKDILERRLQTVVFRSGLARSAKQARQFITHCHIKVNGITVSSPSYLVKKTEEGVITFDAKSTLVDDDHPERNLEKAKISSEKKEELAPVEEKKEEKSEEKPAEKAKEEKKEEPKEEKSEKSEKEKSE